MAEMTTLLAAIYRRYSTSEYKRQRGTRPVITSRFEVFYDETLPKAEVSIPTVSSMDTLFWELILLPFSQEHECLINFEKRHSAKMQ